MASSIGVGVVGTGFMGAAHAYAFRTAPLVFDLKLSPRLEIVADVRREGADAAARRYGFGRAVGSWRELVDDPAVELVSITTPNDSHREIALAALAAGKHVYCEKPLATDWAGAKEMAAAARGAGVSTLVGYNYIRSPAVAYIRRLVRERTIGEPLYWRGIFEEDFLADPATPFSWRCRRDVAGFGALGDLGSHLVGMAMFVMGPIASVVGDTRTVIPERREAPSEASAELYGAQIGAAAAKETMRRVENDDTAHALLDFSSGVSGSLVASRSHWGRKNHLAFEVFGTKGSVLFDQERFNEVQLFLREGDPARQGYSKVLIGPAHPPYGKFTPAPGHGLGFNDLKVAEVAHLLEGLAGDAKLYPTIPDALEIERVLHAIDRSARDRRWVELGEVE
jgi:predicted dehydrogenase